MKTLTDEVNKFIGDDIHVEIECDNSKSGVNI